ncbi:MAG TPA: NnrS family protein [Candidatus Acidoferrum sp.]|nr:NnrS family protein [Candidatus Acidoferrum sp.]
MSRAKQAMKEFRADPNVAHALRVMRERESAMSRLLMAFITSGLVFMLFPGTLLGVWNLLQISGREQGGRISAAWLQAHGHAQVFGWIGSFLLGIGFYSIPKLQERATNVIRSAWACWALWTAGVALRWTATVYLWNWRVLVPMGGALELLAFLIFFSIVSQHRPKDSSKNGLEPWVWVVMCATIGFLLSLAMNLVASVQASLRGVDPAFPRNFDQRYLALLGWGFLVPFVWGFSAKWMRVFLGLKALRPGFLFGAVVLEFLGVGTAAAGRFTVATLFLFAATISSVIAIRIFESSEQEPKIRGIHRSFPVFVRLAYAWLLIAAGLGVAATQWDTSGGFWGASRHALTVGFVGIMVLSVGQRILPAFAGMRLLWSPRLMFVGLFLLAVGCTLRVSSEVLAYQSYAGWAWHVLPVSALVELTALSVFTINMFCTFVLQKSHAVNEPMMVGVPLVAITPTR